MSHNIKSDKLRRYRVEISADVVSTDLKGLFANLLKRVETAAIDSEELEPHFTLTEQNSGDPGRVCLVSIQIMPPDQAGEWLQ